jgi:hypothetical protein
MLSVASLGFLDQNELLTNLNVVSTTSKRIKILLQPSYILP